MKAWNYKGYEAEIDISVEDSVLFGKIAGISDLILFEAETVPGLQVAFKEAVDDYLEC